MFNGLDSSFDCRRVKSASACLMHFNGLVNSSLGLHKWAARARGFNVQQRLRRFQIPKQSVENIKCVYFGLISLRECQIPLSVAPSVFQAARVSFMQLNQTGASTHGKPTKKINQCVSDQLDGGSSHAG